MSHEQNGEQIAQIFDPQDFQQSCFIQTNSGDFPKLEDSAQEIMKMNSSAYLKNLPESPIKKAESQQTLSPESDHFSSYISEESSSFFQSKVYLHKEFQWGSDMAQITDSILQISEKHFLIKFLRKVKATNEKVIKNSLKLKITSDKEIFYCAFDANKQIQDLPLQYFWFAKIINCVIASLGVDICFPYRIANLESQIKTNFKNVIVQGMIYKRSQHLKKWQIRFVVITQEGLISFKGTQEDSFRIPAKTATEIWTRFELIERMLIVKLMHSSRKTQFGIPITNFCVKENKNWLHALYGLINFK